MVQQKVFVLGIDGAMPEKIFEEWKNELPNIKKIRDFGIYGRLNSTIPPISIVAWSSMTTGKRPADFGVFENFYTDITRTNNIRIVSSLNIFEKRVWNYVADHGKKAISCFVPLTWPIKPFNGIILSGEPIPKDKLISYPAEIQSELENFLNKKIKIDLVRFKDLSKEEIMAEIYEITQIQFDSMKYLLKNKVYDLFFGVIKLSDRMNHLFWKYCDPEHRKYDPNSEFKDVLKEYYKYLDKELGEMINLLEKDTIIIVVSDHGITRMHNRINLTDWLIKEGYLVLKEKIFELKEFDLGIVDWEKTKAFAIGAYDGQIYVNLIGRGPTGVVAEEEYESFLNELEIKLKNITGDKGEKLDTKVFKKKDFFNGKCQDSAPDMIVYFDNLLYGCNTTLIGNKTLWSPQTAKGSDDAGHSRQGIFIMVDPNSKTRGYAGEIDVLDVAPTILNKLGIKIPLDMKGKIID